MRASPQVAELRARLRELRDRGVLRGDETGGET